MGSILRVTGFAHGRMAALVAHSGGDGNAASLCGVDERVRDAAD
jgi:hypothetical protein